MDPIGDGRGEQPKKHDLMSLLDFCAVIHIRGEKNTLRDEKETAGIRLQVLWGPFQRGQPEAVR